MNSVETISRQREQLQRQGSVFDPLRISYAFTPSVVRTRREEMLARTPGQREASAAESGNYYWTKRHTPSDLDVIERLIDDYLVEAYGIDRGKGR